MSMLRFSQVKDVLYAPESDGRLDLNGSAGRRLQVVRPGGQGVPPTALTDYVNASLDPVPEDKPVTIMVHGFDFNPLDDPEPDPAASDNPHARLFHFREDNRATRSISWPKRFGFEENDDGANGLVIAFAWDSYTKPYHLKAYTRGTSASWGLVAILAAIREHSLTRRVHIVTHSLGTHVTLNLLRILAVNEHVRALLPAVHRVILMGGAEFVYHARGTYRLLETIPSTGAPLLGQLQIYNFISREDEVISTISGIATYGPLGTEKYMIGYHGLQRGKRPVNWIDLDLTDKKLIKWVENRFNLTLSGDAPNEWLDHWHFFVHKHNTDFMSLILSGAPETQIQQLRVPASGNGIPDGVPQLPQAQTSWAYQDPYKPVEPEHTPEGMNL